MTNNAKPMDLFNSKVTYRVATSLDIPIMDDLMKKQKEEFKKDFFFPSTHEEISELTNDPKKGFVLVLLVNSSIKGFCMVKFPSLEEHYLDGYSFKDCAILDTYMIEKEFRGQGLGSKLLMEAINCIHDKKWLYASVSPKNKISEATFLSLGFHLNTIKPLYQGLIRNVFMRSRVVK